METADNVVKFEYHVASSSAEPSAEAYVDPFKCRGEHVHDPVGRIGNHAPKVPKGGLFPAPVYVATLADGTTARVSFWSKEGRDLDFERGKRLVELFEQQPVKRGYVEYDGQVYVHSQRPPVGPKTDKPRRRAVAAAATAPRPEREFALKLALDLINTMLKAGVTLEPPQRQRLADLLELVA